MERFIYYALGLIVCLAFDPLRQILTQFSPSGRERNLKLLNQKIINSNRQVNFLKIAPGEVLGEIQEIERDSGVSCYKVYLQLRSYLSSELSSFKKYRSYVLGILFQVSFLLGYFLTTITYSASLLAVSVETQLRISVALTGLVLIVLFLVVARLRNRDLSGPENLLNKLIVLNVYAQSQLSIQEVLTYSGIHSFKGDKQTQCYLDKTWFVLKSWMDGGVELTSELEFIYTQLSEFYEAQLNRFQKKLELLKLGVLVFFCVPLMAWNFQAILHHSFGQI